MLWLNIFQIQILEEIISDKNNGGKRQNWEEEILDLSHQTVKLQEELRRRQEVIDKLVYRYTQSEQKVREFIRNTMR